MRKVSIKVDSFESGQRLDVFLSNKLKTLKIPTSRSHIQKLIQTKLISINGRYQSAHYKIRPFDVIDLQLEAKQNHKLKPQPIPLKIIYEDEHILVIDKPSGLVVHPASGNPNSTLVNALLYHTKELSQIDPLRPGIVHRLDKDASGLLVVAKNNSSHLALAKGFKSHRIKRSYLAIVRGRVEFEEGSIDLPIARHSRFREKMTVSYKENSKKAKTFYRVLKRSKDYTLLELIPKTGRTHQLRVHLAFLGYPILGDAKYGNKRDFARLALHAKGLELVHPSTGKPISFKSDMPEEFKTFLINNKLT